MVFIVLALSPAAWPFSSVYPTGPSLQILPGSTGWDFSSGSEKPKEVLVPLILPLLYQTCDAKKA